MTAGELSGHFPVSRPTMSAHFAVLPEANLVDAETSGKTVTYRLQLTVLEGGTRAVTPPRTVTAFPPSFRSACL